jgi:hypothetical protein
LSIIDRYPGDNLPTLSAADGVVSGTSEKQKIRRLEGQKKKYPSDLLTF